MATTGSLRERITVRRQANVKNASTGGLTRTWKTVASMWAEVRSINGREAVIGSVLQGESVFQIVVRHRTDLKASDQVLWNGRELNITAPPEDREGRRRWTVIIASTEAQQNAS
jgi:SPP1 family predicted phage head-tail adaptor